MPAAHCTSGSMITAQVRVALLEDEAFNDVSTLATVVSSRHVRSAIVARRDGVIAGVPIAIEVFRQLDSAVTIRVEAEDGTRVKAGDIVTKGQPLAVMEAMKMEHTMAAPFDGVVLELLYAPGDQVTEGAELLRLEIPA